MIKWVNLVLCSQAIFGIKKATMRHQAVGQTRRLLEVLLEGADEFPLNNVFLET